MNVDYLVKLARLGLAGAVVLFAFLAYRLLSDSKVVTGVDQVCLTDTINNNQTERTKAIASTDEIFGKIEGPVRSAVAYRANYSESWKSAHAAEGMIPSFKEALTKERDAIGSLAPNLKACGYAPRDWKPFYAFLLLQIILAILLFTLEIVKSRRHSQHDKKA